MIDRRMNIMVLLLIVGFLLIGCEEPDTTAPTVTVIYPAHETSISEVVSVTCVATDNVGIEKVELWLDGVSTGLTDHTEPYSFAWNTTQYVDGSTHVVTVRAYDVNDNKGDSDPVTITIDQSDAYPAAVNITSVSYDTEILTVTWSQSSDEDFASYELLYSLTEDGSQSSLGIFADIDSTTYTQTEFDPTHENWYWVKVTDYWGLTSTGIGQTNSIDSVPIASFTVLPNIGTTATVFNFDASESWDAEEATSQLRVRWDWESDGVWDTEYTTTKSASHQFSAVGSYSVKMEVKDSWGSETIQKTIIVAESISDIDGNVYPIIHIGTQVWMAENLKVTHYRDGTAIPNVTDNAEWSVLTTGAYCIYNDNTSNEVHTYGALYNWYAATDSRNIAPAGWHVPSDAEWKELEMALGMSQSDADGIGTRGTNEGSKLAGNADLWSDSALENDFEFGTSGFTALPGGYRGYYDDIVYDLMGYYAFFWSSTENSSYDAWHRSLYFYRSVITRSYTGKRHGISVRLLRD